MNTKEAWINLRGGLLEYEDLDNEDFDLHKYVEVLEWTLCELTGINPHTYPTFGIEALTKTLQARRLPSGWLQVDVSDDLQCNYPGLPEAIAHNPGAFLEIEEEV